MKILDFHSIQECDVMQNAKLSDYVVTVCPLRSPQGAWTEAKGLYPKRQNQQLDVELLGLGGAVIDRICKSRSKISTDN